MDCQASIQTNKGIIPVAIRLPEKVALKDVEGQISSNIRHWVEDTFPDELHVAIRGRLEMILYGQHNLSCSLHGNESCVPAIIDSLLWAIRQEKMVYTSGLEVDEQDTADVDVYFDNEPVEIGVEQ